MKLNLPLKIIAWFLIIIGEISSYMYFSIGEGLPLKDYIVEKSVINVASVLYFLYIFHFIFFADSASKENSSNNQSALQKNPGYYRFIGITMFVAVNNLLPIFNPILLWGVSIWAYVGLNVLYLLYALYHFFPKKATR